MVSLPLEGAAVAVGTLDAGDADDGVDLRGSTLVITPREQGPLTKP